MLLYADEDFPFRVVVALRAAGHDVLTAQDDGRRSVPDPAILARAHALGRAVLTKNRRHFEQLHRSGLPHSAIVSVKQDSDTVGLAFRLHTALASLQPGRWCIRVNRPWRKP
jgi:hypothetical protein